MNHKTLMVHRYRGGVGLATLIIGTLMIGAGHLKAGELPEVNIHKAVSVAGEDACTLNKSSIVDAKMNASDSRFAPILSALQTSAISPATADAGDLVIERDDLVSPAKLRIVVRKPASDQPVISVDDIPEHPELAWSYLRDLFKQAAETKPSLIRFPQDAVIRLRNPDPDGAHLPLKGLTDLVIDFNGSTFTFERTTAGVVIRDAKRVVLRNGIFRSEALLSSIGMAEADTESTVGVRLSVLPEFIGALEAQFADSGNKPQLVTVGRARQSGSSWSIDAVDNVDVFTNRGGSVNNFDYRASTAEGERSAWFQATSEGADSSFPYSPGQLVYMLHLNNSGHGVILKNSDGDVEDITFENIELRNIPGMGIFGELNRGLHLDNVRIIPDVTNPLSFWGSSSDAVHLNNHGGDVVVENSVFGGSADDLFTAKGNWWEVVDLDPVERTVTVGNAGRRYGVHLWGRQGDRLVSIDRDLALSSVSALARDSERVGSKLHKLTIDALPSSLGIGAIVGNPDSAGGRLLIRNNVYRNSRAQGVLLQTRHAIVENNVFQNIAGPAVKLNFALDNWYEGISTGNILVQGNTFDQTAVGKSKPPYSIYVHERNGNAQAVDVIDHVLLSDNNSSSRNRQNSCSPELH